MSLGASKKTFLLTFLVIFLAAAFIISIALGGFFLVDNKYRVDALKGTEKLQVDLGRKLVSRVLTEVIRDLKILQNSPSLRNYLADRSDFNMRQLEDLFQTTSRQKVVYDQIRYLGLGGQERVRVNRVGKDTVVVPLEALQDKSRRYYFTDTSKLGANEVYISPLDLNIEGGEIEVPYKPMIRLGAPVFDAEGNKAGVILINYKASKLLSDIRLVMAGSYGYIEMMNQDGYWVMSHDPKREWGFMFGNKQNFSRLYPDLWADMKRDDKGQMVLGDELYSWESIYVLTEHTTSSTGSGTAYGSSETMVGKSDYFWKLVTHVPRDVYLRLSRENLSQIFILLLILLILSLFGSFQITRLRLRGKQSLHELASSEERQRAIVHCMAEGLMIISPDGLVTASNPESLRLLGCANADLAAAESGMKIDRFIRPELIHRVLSGGETIHVDEDVFITCTGDHLDVSYTASPLVVEDKNEGVVIVFEDISKRKQLKDRLEFLAAHDELTELYNRRQMFSLLTITFNNAMRYGSPFSLCMFDLDCFKQINDKYGHQVGDLVLKEIGRLLSQGSRRADIPGRYGGEEFIVILPETTSDGAQAWAENIRRKVSQLPLESDLLNEGLGLSISCGVATMKDDMSSPKEVITKADKALYAAKESGRNKVCVAD